MRIDRATTGLLIVSVGVNGVLSWRVHRDNEKLATLSPRSSYVRSGLEPGASVPPISGNRPDGEAIEIGYQHRKLPVILYSFTPQCGWCKRNLPAIQQLARQLRGQYDFYALALSETKFRAYIEDNHFDLPVITNLTDDVVSSYMLRATPETIVVSTDGHVLNVWSGAYRGAVKEQIEHTLGVRLPELKFAD